MNEKIPTTSGTSEVQETAEVEQNIHESVKTARLLMEIFNAQPGLHQELLKQKCIDTNGAVNGAKDPTLELVTTFVQEALQRSPKLVITEFRGYGDHGGDFRIFRDQPRQALKKAKGIGGGSGHPDWGENRDIGLWCSTGNFSDWALEWNGQLYDGQKVDAWPEEAKNILMGKLEKVDTHERFWGKLDQDPDVAIEKRMVVIPEEEKKKHYVAGDMYTEWTIIRQTKK
ncbi:MAG: hypothetical protein AAB482_02530 [Patescibacteria group bacterium]